MESTMNEVTTRFDTRHKSRVMHDGRDRAAARAMLHAIGFSDDDLKKPVVGVAHSWIGAVACNFGLRRVGRTFQPAVVLVVALARADIAWGPHDLLLVLTGVGGGEMY